MKFKVSNIILTIILAVFFTTQIPAQASVLENIGKAMHSGDVSGIARYMDNVVDITINNKQYSYSRAQADMVLKDFFSRNAPREYDLQYVGNSQNGNTAYGIGELTTTNGRYRVYLLLKLKTNNNYLLQEIKFER